MARKIAQSNLEAHRVKDSLGISFTHAKRLLRDNSFSAPQLAILNSETGGELTKLLVEIRPELSIESLLTDPPVELSRKELAYLTLEKLNISSLYDLAVAINKS